MEKDETRQICKTTLNVTYGIRSKRLEIVTFLCNNKLNSIFRITTKSYKNPSVVEVYTYSEALKEFLK